MRGRMVHDLDGAQRFLPYGQRAPEVIYSVSRATLNTLLYELARSAHGVESVSASSASASTPTARR